MASSVLFGKMDNHRDPLQQGTQEMVGNKNAAAVLIYCSSISATSIDVCAAKRQPRS